MPTPTAQIPSMTTPTVDDLRSQLQVLDHDTKMRVASDWPAGVPGLKGHDDHTLEQRAQIAAVVARHTKPPVDTAAVDALAAMVDALEARARALPPDLMNQVGVDGRAAGIPQFAGGRHRFTHEHTAQLEALLIAAEDEHQTRRRRVHGALSDAGLNDTDDIRHAILWQLTGRTRSSNDLTASEADHVTDIAKRVELDEAALTFTDDGNARIVARDTGEVLAPPPVQRDWRAWCKDRKVTQKATLEQARSTAERLGLPVPSKLDDLTHPAIVADLDTTHGQSAVTDLASGAAAAGAKHAADRQPVEAPDPAPGEPGDREPPAPPSVPPAASGPPSPGAATPSVLVVVHTAGGLEVAHATPDQARQVLDQLRAAS